MSISSVIKEALSLTFSWLDGGLGVFFVTLLSISFVFKTVKLLCMPRRTFKIPDLPDLPDSVDAEHTELAECFRDDF